MKNETKVPSEKIERVKELSNLFKKGSVLVASVKNIPGSQFQEIVKNLRGKAIVKIPKKSILFRAIDSSGIEEAKKLKEAVGDSFAIIFSDLDSFDLAAELVKNKSPTKAKAGQEALEDIEIPAGPTELVPGPAISELGALGIQIQIEGGKITIKAPKVVAKKGEKISAKASDLMGKLDIKPFTVGFIPLCALDTVSKKLYSEINIDPEETMRQLTNAYRKSLAFAVGVGYASSETIRHLLGKAYSHAKALEKLKPEEKKVKDEEKPKEENAEPDKTEVGENKKDVKTDDVEKEIKKSEDKKEDVQTSEDKSEEENK